MFIKEENEKEISILERKLKEFYDNTDVYIVYEKKTWQPEFWNVIIEKIKKTPGKKTRILEIGAAKSGFPEYVIEKGISTFFAFQDITSRCKEHLSRFTDELYFCPVEEISGRNFDIIFHSYVFEHVTRPKRFLKNVEQLLRVGGCHIIESPRYDLPIYIPPAIRHYGKRMTATYMIKSFLNLYPNFSIVKDPAVFHRKFRRDYDAIHRVTRKSIEEYISENGIRTEIFGGKNEKLLPKMVEKYLRLKIILYKDELNI